MKALILLTVVLLLTGIISAQSSGGFESGVRKALSSYDAAWNNKDAARVSAILADDYVYFTSTGKLNDRKRTLEFLVSPDYKLTFAERSEIIVHQQNGSTAMVSSRWKGRGTYGAEVINDDQRCGLVFAKQRSLWKLLAEHCVQISAQ